ncbi:putative Na+/H+ antiporter [Nitrosomonas sp.]|uniref:putative Na+/H+ antiporter n=1 Tax=Nitrosomonas sp. TaxID=42353 RepID=UPI0025FA1AC6|nr:putative Na+/H+ antiporter [Nitrosomonas sp.]MCC6916999.1 putative Na+/H+ antiporter [Nitrosomonas sp.]
MPAAAELAGAVLFALAILHTFSIGFFNRLARIQPAHAGLWHLLGEVEVVFGFWALILVITLFITAGEEAAVRYIDSCNFTEPMFVFAIMVIAGTRPILQIATTAVHLAARILPLPDSMRFYFAVLSLVPLLGSFITEPAAMTLAALILADHFFGKGISAHMKYATLAVLFVNVSIGGTLTHFAAPPVLMVAGKWSWDSAFMLSTFGWKAVIAVGVNALGATLLFREELKLLPRMELSRSDTVPPVLTGIHLTFLIGVVVFSHHPTIFMGLFLFFLGIAHAYQHYQDRLLLREGLLVAFFLAGLVVLGGQQQWWLQPLLISMSSEQMFLGATLLTAVTDNAALTYLGSLVEGLSDNLKYALVSGAVTGGGLTVIANAPNPAGIAILRDHFDDETVHPLRLLLTATIPTFIAALAFRML